MLCALTMSAGASAQTITTRRESTPWPGVRVIDGRTSGPATDFHAALISLCNDYVHVTATRAPTALQRTSAWANGAGVQLAVNGDFFVAGPRVYGYAIGGGVAWPVRQTGVDPAVSGEWYYRRYGWIGFGPRAVEFSHTEYVKERAASLGVREGWMPTAVTTAVPRGLTALVSGFPELITEGRRVTCAAPTAATCFPDRTDMRARNPRTAMGLTRDRRTLILLTVDGRSSTSAGMYGTEEARLMELLGAWQAFNLDGGGSTTFWQRGRAVVNRPSDAAGERAVANHWGIFAGSASGRPRTPGSCWTAPVLDAGVDGGARDASADVAMDRALTDVVGDRALTDVVGDRALTDVVGDRALTDVTEDRVPADVAFDGGASDAGDGAVDDVLADAAFDDTADDATADDVPEFSDAPRALEEGADAEAEQQPGCGCRATAAHRGGAYTLAALAALARRRRRRP